MKSVVYTLSIVLSLIPLCVHAQINDCENAEVVCSDADLEFNPQGPGNNDFADPDNDPGCIVSLEQNSAWYYFQIDSSAPPDQVLGFIIHPNGGYGEDYDWALYGPDVNCGELGSPLRCSSSSAFCDFCPETGMGMGTTDFTEGPGTGDGFVSTIVVQPGQGFYLMVDNWLGTSNGFVLEWTDSAAAYLNCSAKPPCALDAHAGDDISACEGDEVQLNGDVTGGHGSETFLWTGTNGGDAYLDDPTLPDPTLTFPPGFTGTITYTLTVMEDTCMDHDEMDLIINPLPDVQIDSLGPFCPTDPPQSLTGSPPGGVWGGDAIGSMFSPALSGPGIHTVTYTYTDANSCSAEASMDIIVHEAPEVSISPDTAEFCESENSILLTASASGGGGNYTYSWSTPSGTADGPTYAATLAGVHTVTVTDANGCTDSTAINVVVYLNPEIEINDPGPICASIPFMTLTATPTGGMFEGDIISSQGDILPEMLGPGTYTVSYSFTDNHNCESTDSISITIIPIPEAFAENSGPFCEGDPIELIGSTDGTGSLITYHWTGPNGYSSNEQNPSDATAPGEYFLQVTVDDCPSELSMTTVVIHYLPEAIATNGGPYCSGESIGLMGSTNESGNAITYSWSGPNGYTSDVQNPMDATDAGIYTLVITVDGCISEPTTTEVQFGDAPDAIASNSGPYCEGEAIELFGNTSGSGNVIDYQWVGPGGYVSSLQNPTDATAPGLYQLVVAVDGCASDTVFTTVVINASPQPVITGQSAFCTGFSSTLDAGAGYTNYLWEDSSTNQTLEVFASGTYVVTVTDLNGCTGTASFAVTENSSLSPVITGTLEFCEGSSTTLDAGSGYVTYAWSTGENTQTIQVNTAGNIEVIVSDAAGCTGSAVVNTVLHPNPDVMIGGSTTYCIGGHTVLDAGSGFATYQWSNDSTTQTITVASPGTYAVTVIDNNGCSGSATVGVDESTSLNPVITGNLAFCESGSTTLNAGSGFATYLWSDNSTKQTLVVTVAGNYSVTVTDGQGCSGETTVSVTEVSPPSAQVQTDTSLCNTLAGGSKINLYDLVLAGDMQGTWQDVDNSGAAGLFTDLNFASVPAGDYRFLYTTNSAITPCPEASYEVIVTVIDCTCPDVFFLDADPLCNAGDVIDVTTIENTTEAGTWSLLQSPGGTNPAALNGTLFDPTGSDTGTYVLQFSLQNQPPPGCPSDFDITLQVSAAVNAGVAAQPMQICSEDDQVISLGGLITGADPNGTWKETSASPSQGNAFNPANGTFTTTGQAPGSYIFIYTLQGQGACPDDTAEVAVVINAVPTAVAVNNVVIDCANPVQSLDATGSSSGPEYSITWTGPGLQIDGNEHTLHPNINQAGTYVLTIENIQSGCSSIASVTVTANTDPPTDAVINSHDPACFGEQNGFIHLEQVIGGEPPYVYSLNGQPFNTTTYFDNLPAGDYDLAVEDQNGCLWDSTFTLVEPAVLNIDIGPDIELALGESATVHATINLPPDQIDMLTWQPGNVIECLDVNCLDILVHTFNPVTLTATVIDTNGCQDSDQLSIAVNKDRHVFIPSVFSPNGDGINDVFFIHGDQNQIVEVKDFKIFNRWGGLVFEALNFSPNDPSIGWDGLDNKGAIDPGVFTYYAKIEFIDKRVLTYTGDVTLVR